MSLEGEVAFSVISDLRGDERLLNAALTQLPEKILDFARRKKISRGKSWPGLDRLVLIGNTPGHQLDDKTFMKFNPAWEGYLVPKFQECVAKGGFENGRIPKAIQEYGPAALASWFEKNGRHELDKQSALEFRTYVGERDWKTGTWDTQHEGVATQNYRKFWKNVAKAIEKAPFSVSVMPTDRIYAEEVPEKYDLSWDRQTIGSVTFRSMPIRKIQNKHFIHALALTPVHDLTKSPRRRDGTFYSFETFRPLDADVTIGYLFPTEFDKMLSEEHAQDEALRRPSRERLLIFSYDLLLKDESHKKRAQAHLPARIYEEPQGKIATYVIHGKQAWRVQHTWNAAKGLILDENEELINFVKPKPAPTIVAQEVTEESAALQLLSAPENFNMFIAALRGLNPEAAADLQDQQVTSFEGLAHLQSGLYHKVNELTHSQMQVNADKETFFSQLLDVLGCQGLPQQIRETVRKEFKIGPDAGFPESAYAHMWKIATKEITDRYTGMVNAVTRANEAFKEKEAQVEKQSQVIAALEQTRDAAQDALLKAALHHGIPYKKGDSVADGAQALLAYAADQRAAVLKLNTHLEERDKTFQEEFDKKNKDIEALEKDFGSAQDALVVHLVGMLKPVYDCYHSLDDVQLAAQFDKSLEAVVGKDVFDFLALLPAGESFEIQSPDVAKTLYERSAQVYQFTRTALRRIGTDYLKASQKFAEENRKHNETLQKLSTERLRNNEIIGNYSENINNIKLQFDQRVEKRAGEIAGTRIRDLEARASGLERQLEVARRQAEELPLLERDKIKDEHTRSTTVIKRTHQDELAALRSEYEGKLDAMRAEYEQRLKEAESVHGNGQLAASKQLYADTIDFVAKIAYELVAKGHYVEGDKLYTLLLAHTVSEDNAEKRVKLYRNRGVARINAKDAAGALEDFSAALALKPGDKTIEVYRAEAARIKVTTNK